jgi:hypothetical protein
MPGRQHRPAQDCRTAKKQKVKAGRWFRVGRIFYDLRRSVTKPTLQST